jgi:hypothetical protein
VRARRCKGERRPEQQDHHSEFCEQSCHSSFLHDYGHWSRNGALPLTPSRLPLLFSIWDCARPRLQRTRVPGRAGIKSPCLEPSASNSQEAARSDCRFRSPYLDATEQTMSDRSDSDFIQRPSSTHSGQSRHPIAVVQRIRLSGDRGSSAKAANDPERSITESRRPRAAAATAGS